MAEVVFFEDCFELRESKRDRIQEGHSIRDFLDIQGIAEFQHPTLCLVNEKAVLRKEWSTLEVTESDVVIFLRLPAGGGGGGGGGKVLKVVLAVVITVAAIYTGGLAAGAYGAAFGSGVGATVAGALTTAAVTIAGNALVNAFLPPPKPKLQSSSGTGGIRDERETSPTYSITASGNKARLGDSIPEIYGRHKVFMDLGATPYTRYESNDQYLYQFHCIGRGEYEIEETLIGDTDINNFEEVETELIPPDTDITLFHPHVVTSLEINSFELPTTEWRGPFTINQASSTITKIEVDVLLPKGLYYSNDDGGLDNDTVTYRFEAREIDDYGDPIGSFFLLGEHDKTAASADPIRLTYDYSVPSGRYEIRVKRVDVKQTNFRYGNNVVIQAVKGYLEGPIQFEDMTFLAVKMRASDNLSQNSSKKINCIVKRKIPVWDDETGWSAPQYSSNPAWVIADIVQRVNDNSYDAFDLDELLDQADQLDNESITYNAIFDSPVSTREALNQVAKVAKGIVIEAGGKFRLIRDTPTLIPTMMFTPNNIIRGSLSIEYAMPTEDTASTVELSYFDEKLWKFKEVLHESLTANKGQTAKIRMIGITKEEDAKAMAEYIALANVYRRRTLTFRTGLEGMIPSYGDLISVTDDVVSESITGEVIAYDSVSKVFTLSENMPSNDATNWFAGFRNRDGSNSQIFEFTVGPELNQITLSNGSFTPYVGGNEERTLFVLNHNTEWNITAKVIALRPQGGEEVEIVCTPEDLRVYGITGEAGIPADAAGCLVLGLYKPGGPVANDTGYHVENQGVPDGLEESLTLGTYTPGGEIE